MNFYRPPDTIFEEFKEALEDVRKFIEDLERDKDISTPTITLTGDLNLPFMSDWSEAALESFSGKVQCQVGRVIVGQNSFWEKAGVYFNVF